MEDFNGEILVNGNILLSPKYTLDEFKRTNLFIDEYNTSIFFWLEPDCIAFDQAFRVGLYFRDGILNEVNLGSAKRTFKDERTRSTYHKEFVKSIAKKNEYDWGKIVEYFSPREGYSTVIIRYK